MIIMKVLWITNIIFPEATSLLGGDGQIKGSGGWILGAAQRLVSHPDMQLAVASISTSVQNFTCLNGEKIRYYLLPYGHGNLIVNHEYEPLWKKVEADFSPDVVHIHGTEMSHGLAYIEACGSSKVCISVQGLTSACYEYYLNGVSKKEIKQSVTLLSFFLGGMKKNAEKMKNRGKYEKEMIRRVHHIMGRTSWDRERIWGINPEAKYYTCNETLRPEFYDGHLWKYSECQKHSIFMSQAGQTIKGLHMLLRALPLVLRKYPDTVLRIAGNNLISSTSFKQRLLLSDYGKLLRCLIKKNSLEGKVFFTGQLNGEEMREEYLKANVFVCPSSIENSPNSLGEAQILGVPVIASYVGGIPDMMQGDEEHLYRFEEVEMLAFKLVLLFKQEDRVDTTAMRQKALMRHDQEENMKELIKIYNTVRNDEIS